jgi:hypothetical protein
MRFDDKDEMRRILLTVPILLAIHLSQVGCELSRKVEQPSFNEVSTKGLPGSPPITVGDLDQLARNCSDRLVARLASACDHLKREALKEETRAKAHQLKLSVALAAYDVVTAPAGTPDVPAAGQHLLDLAILTELHSIHWIEERAALETFGKSGEQRLTEAFGNSREDVWELTRLVMPPEQIDQLKILILRWRQENPNVEWISRVRLDAIAAGKEGSGFTKSVAQRFTPIESALRSVNEARLMAQQAFFYLKRMPGLLDWTAEATVSDALDAPKVAVLVQGMSETLAGIARATTTLELLLQPSSQEPSINSTLKEVKESLIQGTELIRETHDLQTVLEPLLHKQKKEEAAGVDVAQVASQIGDAAREATSLVRETRALAESASALENVDKLLARTSKSLTKSGHDMINHLTVSVVEIVLLIAILTGLYKGTIHYVRKRRAPPASSPP